MIWSSWKLWILRFRKRTIRPIDTQLLEAITARHTDKVAKLLLAGADPNCCEDEARVRPLHFAALYNAHEAVYYLLMSGAHINSKTSDGYRPIDIAVHAKNHLIVDMLKRFSANETWE